MNLLSYVIIVYNSVLHDVIIFHRTVKDQSSLAEVPPTLMLRKAGTVTAGFAEGNL